MTGNAIREALEPCPFCGDKHPHIEVVKAHSHGPIASFMPDHPGSAFISCTSCEAMMTDFSEEAVIAAWNCRASTAYDAIGGVMARALEWEHHPQASGQVRAPSPWGTYRIVFFGDYALWGCRADGLSLGNKAASIDEAKAAAQADFERRVLSCLSPVAMEGADAKAAAWRDMASAPKDGTLLALLVRPCANDEDGAWTPFEDSRAPQPTIGFNNFDDTEEDRWQFAGWSWCHDTIVEGHGEVMGWRPFGEKLPSVTPEETVLAAIAEWGEGPCDDLEQLQRQVALALRSHSAASTPSPQIGKAGAGPVGEAVVSRLVNDIPESEKPYHGILRPRAMGERKEIIGAFKAFFDRAAAHPVEEPGDVERKLRERLEKVETALRTAKALASQHYDPSIDSEFAAMAEIDAALTGDAQEGGK